MPQSALTEPPSHKESGHYSRLLLAIFAFGVAMLAGTALMALLAPQSRFASYAARVLPLADIHAARADTLLAEGYDLESAARETHAALEISPGSVRDWLRLVAIDRLTHRGQLTQTGLDALRQSYAAAPEDAWRGLWRLQVGFDCWDQLDDPLRRAALDEMRGLWTLLGLRDALRNVPQGISNPTGRLALSLTLRRLELQG